MPGRNSTANFFIDLNVWLQDKTSVSWEEWEARMNLKKVRIQAEIIS